jgi:hypothetical protein
VFQCTGKAMGQVYQCWWRICREINVFPRFEYHMFYILYPFVTCLLTLPHIKHWWPAYPTCCSWINGKNFKKTFCIINHNSTAKPHTWNIQRWGEECPGEINTVTSFLSPLWKHNLSFHSISSNKFITAIRFLLIHCCYFHWLY